MDCVRRQTVGDMVVPLSYDTIQKKLFTFNLQLILTGWLTQYDKYGLWYSVQKTIKNSNFNTVVLKYLYIDLCVGGKLILKWILFNFYIVHHVLLLLTVNKIYLLPSDTTYNLVYYNIYGRLVSVNWDHLQALYIKLRANCSKLYVKSLKMVSVDRN